MQPSRRQIKQMDYYISPLKNVKCNICHISACWQAVFSRPCNNKKNSSSNVKMPKNRHTWCGMQKQINNRPRKKSNLKQLNNCFINN